MKRLASTLTIFLLASSLLAQEATTSALKTKMLEVHNRPARDIFAAVRGLKSSSPMADLSFNDEMHTITVRDYPENIATIEEAIARLDRPVPAPADIELKIYLLVGSKTPLSGPATPDDLAPVVKQLQAALRYSHYGLLAANLQHTRAGEGIEGSGIAEQSLVGGTTANPVFYNYRLQRISVDGGTVTVENCNFGMRVPVTMQKGVQYENVGFKTPVTIQQNEKVVIGTTTMGDRAVIVVLMAKVGS